MEHLIESNLTDKSIQNVSSPPKHLANVLKPIHLWALSVGLVISGNYFGWSYGFGTGGPIGLAIALIPVTLFYVTFILSFSELAAAIPQSGGPCSYAERALGPFWGYISGISSLIEFTFAPPAIALAIGGYVHQMFPFISILAATVYAFSFFIFINFFGIKTSIIFELIVTLIALVGLLIYWGYAIPHFELSRVLQKPLLPHGIGGIMSSVPFAIWFFLAIEGGALVAEEMVNPQRDIPKGFLTGIATVTIMAFFTLFLTAGIVDYRLVQSVDFPLPMALTHSLSANTSYIIPVLNIIGLFGLIASLHGIIVGYSRQTYAMSFMGYLPKFLSYVHIKFRTPIMALIVPGIIGLTAALTGLTNAVITLSVFGSVIMYFISLVSLFVLRKKEPFLHRPFKVYYPLVPVISIILCVFCLLSLVYSYVSILFLLSSVYFIAIIYYFKRVVKSTEFQVRFMKGNKS